MKIVVNAIATLGFLNDKGVFDLDIQSSKTVEVGVIGQSEKLPEYDDRI